MSDNRQIKESPSQILTRYYEEIRKRGKGQIGQYCLGVALRYNRLHADQARTLPFDLQTGTPTQIQDRVFKTIDRWMDPNSTQHTPADALLVLADEMPDDLRRPCWCEVLGAMDHVAVRRSTGEVDYCDSFSQLLNVFASLTKAAAPLIADGVLDSRDRPHAPAMLKRIEEMKGVLAGWDLAIRKQVMGE